MNTQAIVYSNRQNAIRAAKIDAVKHGITSPLVEVHFRINEVEGGHMYERLAIADGCTTAGQAAAQSRVSLEKQREPEMAAAEAPSAPEATDTPAKGAKAATAAPSARKRGAGGGGKKPKAETVAKAPKAPKPATERKASKADEVITLLQRETGATIADIHAITGWLPHTTRAFISTKPKALGLTVSSEKGEDGVRVYRVSQPASA